MVDRLQDGEGECRLPFAGGRPENGAQSDARPEQLQPNDRVERIRRIQLNDLESLPYFLVAGLLFVLTEPSLLLAQIVLYGYVVTRFMHFVAYFTSQTHDMRAMLWTPGSLILIFMTLWVLVSAIV